jgi:hypothetical protein
VEFRLRNLPNAITGFTPFQLRHARHPRFAGIGCDAQEETLTSAVFPRRRSTLPNWSTR